MRFKRKNGTSVFADTWSPGTNEKNVPKDELSEGEISASTFRIGCYTVRRAIRVYEGYGRGSGKKGMKFLRRILKAQEAVLLSSVQPCWVQMPMARNIP